MERTLAAITLLLIVVATAFLIFGVAVMVKNDTSEPTFENKCSTAGGTVLEVRKARNYSKECVKILDVR